MNDLKISDAAKQLVASFVDDNAWNSLSAHWKETASRTAQGIINSELDRIAGPLAETLAASLNELRRICKESNWLIGVGSEVLENYRKERGQ